MTSLSIAIVDDEKNIRRSFEIILKAQKFNVMPFESGEAFLKSVKTSAFDIVFLDVNLPGADGIDILKQYRQQYPQADVVMISGQGTLSVAVEATRAGAYDFLEKPLQKEKILLSIRNLQERKSLTSRYAKLQASVEKGYQMVGESPAIEKIYRQIGKVAPTDSKVLITGESGVGKELVAYAIHSNSARHSGPFVKMNCAAIPEDLTESELFGNEKGAFTGASERRDGKFLQADGGTFFLDEIGDMSLRVQTKVLRVLQDGEFQRVGGKDSIKVDVRIVAATNKNLQAMVEEGSFREDLYFRLNVLPIHLPPLRERASDVPLLAQHFIETYCQRNHSPMPRVDDTVYGILKKYHWPGNIRELQNLVERLIIMADHNHIKVEDLPPYLFQSSFKAQNIAAGSKTLSEVREEAERTYIKACLDTANGNVSQAARLLGMERTNLHKKMKSLGIVKKQS